MKRYGIALLALAVIAFAAYAQIANITSTWVNGNLVFEDATTKNDILTIKNGSNGVLFGYAAEFDAVGNFDLGITVDGGLTDIGGGTYSRANGDNDIGVAGDLEVVGTLEADGAVEVDGGLVDIGGGTYTLSNGDADLGVNGDLEVNGTAQLDGTLTVASTLTATGNIVANGNVTGDGATVLSGMIVSVSTTQGSRSLVATDSQKVVVNASSASTLTLPTSVAGLVYTVLIRTSTTTYIDCAGTDRIYGTNADGDRISSATEGETITLLGVGTSGTHNWYPMTKTGTWADAN